MGDLFGILVVLLALVSAVVGASCAYALAAEREPHSGSPMPPERAAP